MDRAVLLARCVEADAAPNEEEETMKITTTLKRDKETKGTVVFSNETEGTPVSTLYVAKSAFDGKLPAEDATVTVTLEVA
jgi:hypothetical protein